MNKGPLLHGKYYHLKKSPQFDPHNPIVVTLGCTRLFFIGVIPDIQGCRKMYFDVHVILLVNSFC